MEPRPGVEVAVQCDYPHEFNEGDKYLCREKDDFECEEISPKRMSITVRSEQDDGSYWCGLKFSTHRILIHKVLVQCESLTMERPQNRGFVSQHVFYIRLYKALNLLCMMSEHPVCI